MSGFGASGGGPSRASRRYAEPSFVLIERHNLSPASLALLAQLARHCTLIPVPGRPRHSFRVGVKDAGSEADAVERLVAVLDTLDKGWEEHFTRPRPFSGR